MKFVYEYRTRDNAVHNGVVEAKTREAAFAALKKTGVRPSRMTEAPGVFNKLFGKGKRWMLIGVLVVAIAAVTFALTRTTDALQTLRATQLTAPRHQIYGDPTIMSELTETEFAAVFDNAGERFIARYAQPGDVQAIETTPVPDDAIVASALTNRIVFVEGESREIRELKQIVNGMKDELRDYLNRGGSFLGYRKALVKRQVEEIRIRKRVEQELKGETDGRVWASKNARLRDLGIAAIVRE